MNQLPSISEVLADPCASDWLKDALRSALKRDMVDAANDAQFLAELLTARLELLQRHMHAMTAEGLRHWNQNDPNL